MTNKLLWSGRVGLSILFVVGITLASLDLSGVTLFDFNLVATGNSTYE